MWKDRIRNISNVTIEYVVRHSKVAFPVIVIAAVAVTVSVALNTGRDKKLEKEGMTTEATESAEETQPVPEENVPMALNEDPAITALINTYYIAVADGDTDMLSKICDEVSLQDMLGYQERSKYINKYRAFEIYTKPGFEEGSTVAFVYYKALFADHEEEFPGYSAHYISTDEEGNLYFKRANFSDEQNAYLGELMSQADVVEFNNRVTVEYNELMVKNPELLEYLSEMDAEVNAAVGVSLADQNSETVPEVEEPVPEGEAGTESGDAAAGRENTGDGAQQEPAEEILYVTATTTVNVRSSDSEKADKIGKVTGGTQLQVLEQKPNGWTKVLFEKKEGYIKTEFLELAESADGAESIGRVTATTNINVRASASETADRLGVLAGGDSVDLLANENGWCKIKYNGKVGYVKAEYVQ